MNTFPIIGTDGNITGRVMIYEVIDQAEAERRQGGRMPDAAGKD